MAFHRIYIILNKIYYKLILDVRFSHFHDNKEIPDFLSEEECDFIMNQAVKQGLENSVAKGGLTPKLMPILPDNGKTISILAIFVAMATSILVIQQGIFKRSA